MNPFSNAKLVGQNVSNARYLAQESKRGDPGYVMGRSDLMEFARCPHRWRAGYKSNGSDATEWGTLIDTLLLSPGDFDSIFVELPETYPAEVKGKIVMKPWHKSNWTDCWSEEFGSGKGLIEKTSDEIAEARSAVKLIRNDYDASCLLEGAQTQVMVAGIYEDEETGIKVPVKALLDIVPALSNPNFGKTLADLKCIRDASNDGWPRMLFRMGWHVQAAFHWDLYIAATGEDRCDWLHLLQENFPPFEVAHRHLSEAFVNIGRDQYRSALRLYARSLKNDDWPTYDDLAPCIIPGWPIAEPEEWMVDKGKLSMRELRPIDTVLAHVGQEDEREVVP